MKKNVYIRSFNYGKLNKEKERRGTEDNHIIYHPKQDTFGCSIDT